MCAISDAFFTPYLGHGEAVRIIDPELGTLERETIDSNIGGTVGANGGNGNNNLGSNINNNGNRKRGMSRRESNSGNLFHFPFIVTFLLLYCKKNLYKFEHMYKYTYIQIRFASLC